MKHFLTLVFLCAFFCAANSQSILTPKAQAIGGQTVFLKNENALFGNPAGLATMEKWAATAAFERRFLLADLNLMGAAAALPTRSGTFGLNVQNFGFDEFRQQTFGFVYARKLTKMLRLGGQVDFLQTQINEYGNTGTLSFQLGLQAELSDELSVGTQIVNPARAEYADGENLPTVIKAGASYSPSENVMVGFELEKDVDFPLNVRAGIEYLAAPILRLRAGFSSDPGQFHFGLGIHLASGLRVDTAVRYHQTLGLTPTVGLLFGELGN